MNYYKIKWNHSFPDEPIWLYSEIDDARWEVRKVEIFADGKIGFADQTRNSGNTRLGEEPLPEMANIAADPQFEPMQIPASEFEVVWQSSTK